jgi:DNA processing protein
LLSDTAVASVGLAEDAGVSPRLFALLVLHFGTPEAVLEVSPDRLARASQVSAAQAEAIGKVSTRLDEVRARLEELAGRGVSVVSFFDDLYPEALRRIAEPPSFFYLRGALTAAGRCLAVIGGADAAADAIGDAVGLGKRLASLRVGVVSGLEQGIDAGAHVGVLAAGGTSLAVASSGLERIEPAEHRVLAEQIAAVGGVLSEHAPGLRASRVRTAQSDRIIAALAQAVVVIAPEEDAAHLTRLAESTLHLGKPVFVLARDRSPAVASLFSLGAYPLLQPDDIEAALAYI